MNVRKWSLSAAIICLGLLLPQTLAQDSADPAEWAPADAFGFVGVSDVGRLIKDFEQTAFYKLTQDESLKDIGGQVNLLTKFLDAFKQRLAAALDTEPAKLKNPFGGRFVVYFTKPEKSDQPPGAVVVAGVKDMDLMQAYYTKAGARFREICTNYTTETFSSFTIDCYLSTPSADDKPKKTPGEPNEPSMPETSEEAIADMFDKALGEIFSPGAMPEKLATCLTNDRLVVAATPDEVKAVLRRERGGEHLGSAEDYQKLLRTFNPVGNVRMLGNVPAWVALAEERADDQGRRMLRAMGLHALRSVIGHLHFSHEAYESKLEILQLVSGERSGLVKLLSPANSEVAPPRIVPAKAMFCTWANIGVSDIFNEFERILRAYDPEQAEVMRNDIEAIPLPNGEKLNLRRELENFTGPFVLSLEVQQPFSPDAARIMVGYGHRDKSATAKLLNTITAFAPITERESPGGPVFDAPFGGVSLAASQDFLLVGTTPAVEAGLRSSGDDRGLASDEAFRKAAEQAPREAWGGFYADARRMWEASLEFARNREAIRSSAMTNPALAIVGEILASMTMNIKEDKLAGAGRMVDYVATGLSTLSTTPDGILFTQVQMRPAAK